MRKPFVIFFRSLRSLSISKLLKLGTLTIKHPLFSMMGFWATLKAFAIVQKKFPNSNSGNGKGNAFRHALWSALILSYCSKISSPEKAKNFSLKMTSLHEDLFPNTDLEKKMDLHNNQVGIDLFFELLPGIHRQFFETSFLIDALTKKLEKAKKINSRQKSFDTELVYLDDDMD
ncbi:MULTISPECIES: DUF6973 domain-containing protein [Amniculibacterium]|uniref:DUF6973 domain-containing protein n=1 Tax=Amniculibacterium TaxID=2715289 RepID=UPI000F5A2A4A|nr:MULTISPECIES: hypothetical protein [Amniculibacterium]